MVYVSREGEPSRRVANEEQLLTALEVRERAGQGIAGSQALGGRQACAAGLPVLSRAHTTLPPQAAFPQSQLVVFNGNQSVDDTIELFQQAKVGAGGQPGGAAALCPSTRQSGSAVVGF